MGEKRQEKYPYETLGLWLKRMRQKKQQSIAEVSGAVEVDVEHLTKMEKGLMRPSEDILMLLISYFAVKEDEAVKIWEMAGYEQPDVTRSATSGSQEETLQPIIVMPMDARIVYTDVAKVQTTKYGLTINFLQSDGIGGKPLAVARVGMSKEHAERLIGILQQSLVEPEQKLLPAPETPPKKDEA